MYLIIFLGYTVRYMVKDMIHTMVETNLTEDTLNFKLNKLKPSTHYTFEVYALTEVGKGKVSKATIQSGVEPVLPSPPTRLAVSNIGKKHALKKYDQFGLKVLAAFGEAPPDQIIP